MPDTAAPPTEAAVLSEAEVAALNDAYLPLGFEARIRKLYEEFAPEQVLVTSSFAATSAYFLHIVSRIRDAARQIFAASS